MVVQNEGTTLKKYLAQNVPLLLLSLALTLFGVGCTHGPSKLEVAMSSWVGKPAAEMLAVWGAPDTSLKLDDGTSVLTWKKIWFWNQYRHECRKSFTVGADGNVKKWVYNDC
jgi:hypothetical protein